MSTIHKPVIHIQELGEQGVLPNGGIINAGGTEGPFFTVGGKGLLFDDGSSSGGGGGGGGAATFVSGGLFFIDATPSASGIVGSKIYAAGTVPINKVIIEATTDTSSVLVMLLAEGPSAFYSPVVTITTLPAQIGGAIVCTLAEDMYDKRTYVASAVLVGISTDTTVTATSSTNATATFVLRVGAAAPTISALMQGPYPGSQTALKAGDVLTISGSVQNSATYAEILAGGAASSLTALTLGAMNSASSGFKSISGSFTVSNLTGLQSISARARNSLGSFGAAFTSLNTRLLDQVFPLIGTRSIVYPIGQAGLKLSEEANITTVITNFTTVSYSGTNIFVTAPTLYASTKTITRNGGSYIVGTQNYTISANKAENNSTSTVTSAVSIANVPPTAAISISGNPTRLFSSAAGTNYTITITADQQLLNAPTLLASAGTWQGVWSGSGSTWTRDLRILDTHPKGAQLFSGMVIAGLAGINGTVISAGSAYFIGGFNTRTITFAPFERFHFIGTPIVDFSKVTASYTGSTVLTKISSTVSTFQSFTIVDVSGVFSNTGSYLFISDASFAGSNTTGALQLDVSEVM